MDFVANFKLYKAVLRPNVTYTRTCRT